MSAWEYRTTLKANDADLEALGREDWELIATDTDVRPHRYIFKRERLSFREQITLDQKRRYYAEWGIKTANDDGSAKR